MATWKTWVDGEKLYAADINTLQTIKADIQKKTAANIGTLDAGEFGFLTDTKELHIGSSVGNLRVLTASSSGDYLTPQMFGAVGDNVNDDTAAIQDCLDAGPTGSLIFFPRPPSAYLVTSTLTISQNRLHLLGGNKGQTYIYFDPPVPDALFEFSGGTDNIVFENLGFQNLNLADDQIAAIVGGAGDSALSLIGCFVQSFTGPAIDLDSAMYLKIEGCRFINQDNSAHGGTLAYAIRILTFGNHVQILNNRFAQNDKSIYIVNGSSVLIQGNAFEADGDSGNALIDRQVHIAGGNGINVIGNYFEGEKTAVEEPVVYYAAVNGGAISGNYFNGQLGAAPKSDMFVWAANCYGVSINNNSFVEPTTYFTRGSTRAVKQHDNYYYKGGAIVTYAVIAAATYSPAFVEINIPLSFNWNPGAIGDGAGLTVSQALEGAALGDAVIVYPPYDLTDVTYSAYVQSANTVEIRVQNESGGGVNLGNGTWKIMLIKPS